MPGDDSAAVVPAARRLLLAVQDVARHAVRGPRLQQQPAHPKHSVCALARAGQECDAMLLLISVLVGPEQAKTRSMRSCDSSPSWIASGVRLSDIVDHSYSITRDIYLLLQEPHPEGQPRACGAPAGCHQCGCMHQGEGEDQGERLDCHRRSAS